MARNRKRDKATGSRSQSSVGSQVIVDPDAHRDIEAHCAENPSQEVCGVLVGFTWPEPGGQRTRVVGSVRGAHARQGQMSVTFTHDTWQAVHEAIERRTDDARVVGWYHSHPDFGVFYSSQDVFVHRHFFGDVGQLGLVIDPIRGQCGAFLSTASGIEPIRRFEVARANASGHLVSCAYAPEAVQDSGVEAVAAAVDDAAVLTRLDSIEATVARLERTARSARNGVLLACVLLAVVALMSILAWIFPLPPLSRGAVRPGEQVIVLPSGSVQMPVAPSVPAPPRAEAPIAKRSAPEASKPAAEPEKPVDGADRGGKE
jgi:proteasome lid subunit RPN8/RPN11